MKKCEYMYFFLPTFSHHNGMMSVQVNTAAPLSKKPLKHNLEPAKQLLFMEFYLVCGVSPPINLCS